jgi:hypothetical protein
VAAVGGGPAPLPPAALVLTSDREPDVLFVRQAPGWTAAGRLPCRGSRGTTGALVGDLDLDGDDDLVMVRASSLPRILFAQRLQLQSLGVAQLGRPAGLRLRARHPGVAALLVGQRPARLPLPPFGLLRLEPAGLSQLALLPVPAGGAVDLTLPTAASWPELELALQAGYLDVVANAVTLTNLEHLTLARR